MHALLEQLTIFSNASIVLEDVDTHRSTLCRRVKAQTKRRQSNINIGKVPEANNAGTQGRPEAGLMALWIIVSHLFVHLIFSGSRFNFPIISDIHILLFYNHCDKSELHFFGPFLFCLRVSWSGGHKLMMNIQEMDKQELSRQIFFKCWGHE